MVRLIIIIAALLVLRPCLADNGNGRNKEDGARTFQTGDQVDLWVNKLTSSHTQLPIGYYALPLCQPKYGPQLQRGSRSAENSLGQALTRNHRISSSPYQLYMRKDMFCEQVCLVNLGRGEVKGAKPNRMVQSIRDGYRQHWIVDQSLEAASRLEDSQFVTTRYSGGFPLGFVGPVGAIYPSEPIQYAWRISSKKHSSQGSSNNPSDHKAFIYNHVNLLLEYHATGSNQYRIVRFTVEPFSIAHEWSEPYAEAEEAADQYHMPRVVKMNNTIPSCQFAYSKQGTDRLHTSYDMLVESKKGPQLAAGKVLFTYDVIWVENPNLEWANRWDIYMRNDNTITLGSRWTDFCNGLITAVVAAAIVMALTKAWVKHRARRGRGRYSKIVGVSNDPSNIGSARDGEQIIENPGNGMRRTNTGGSESDSDDDSSTAEHAWREDLEHFVFTPPSYAPHLLVSLSGLGAQLLVTCLVVLIAAAMGVPVARVYRVGGGATGGVWTWMLTTSIVVYVLVGGPVCGYVTARMSQLLLLEPPSGLPPVHENHTRDTGDRTVNDDSVPEVECDPVFCSSHVDDATEELPTDNVEQRNSFSVALAAAREKINFLQLVRVLLFQAAFPLTLPILLLTVNLLETSSWIYLTFPISLLGTLVIINLCILLPLLALGYFVGMKKPDRAANDMANHHLESSNQDEIVPPQTPRQPCYTHPAFFASSGLLSFIVVYNEFRYMLFAMWDGQNYGNVFGFLLVVFVATLTLSSLFSMLGTYTMLCHENYQWWWSAFITGGSIAIFGYIYAMTLFLAHLHITTWTGFWIYLLNMTWICFAWFTMMGFIGLSASLWFNRHLYYAIKAN